MQMIRRIIWGIPLLLFLTVPCFAVVPEEIAESQSQALGLEELEDAGEQWLHDQTPGSADLDKGLASILDTGLSELGGNLRKAAGSGVFLLAIVLFCGFTGDLTEHWGGSSLPVTTLAGTLAITAVAVADVEALLGLGKSTLEDLASFANILFPAVTALTAATGAITGGAVRQMAAMFFGDLLLNLMNGFLLPLVYAFLAASVAHAALGNNGLKRVSALLKWTATITLTILLISFVAYLTLSGVVAGHADAATIKATKFALSSTIPVVGGILSDAAETVLAGTGILRGTVGIYGALAILAMCVTPFLRLGTHYLVYKLTAALASTVADGRLVGLIDSIGAAFGLILGMTGAGTLITLISLVSALAVTSV